MKDIFLFFILKEAKFMPLTDPPVYNSCNLLIFLNIKKNTNEAGKKFIAIFHKNYVNYYIILFNYYIFYIIFVF